MSSSTIIPAHVAVIMDGNGRWANRRGLPRSKGHKAGTEAARAIVRHCREIGVRHLTLYTFSKENWSRPKDEVGTLFDLLVSFLKRELGQLVEQDIRLKVLGELSDFPLAVRKALEHAISKSSHCRAMTVNLALNYSGREEIMRACRSMIADGLDPKSVTEEAMAERLYTAGQPDPDLIIRTSGELRLSNYLLWQAAYSEFYFTDIHWPDFSPEELDKAILDFSRRQRRFGKTGEQIEQDD
ncbi:isoprenyl transferase [Salidesulfovibrio brasiliensis]|uniref:isoprenyl transferase n=1 Tax=Salidesulfovibrio brasiliensis TaxID=221711 RepID=UPI0006D0BD9D|nr:isoprenyl transferase [Salidesulfovibrio brasiliensis]